MLEAGYTQSQHDHYLFIHHDSCSIAFLVVYVDDIIIIVNTLHAITDLKKLLHSKVDIRDTGH